MSDTPESSSGFSRRSVLKHGTTLAGGSLIAGCADSGGNGAGSVGNGNGGSGSGNGNGGNGSGNGNSSGNGGDGSYLRIWRAGTEVISNLQWNPHNSSTEGTGAHQAGGYLYDFLAISASNTGEMIPNILDDWSVEPSEDGTTIDMQFREDYTWHNGDQLTAQDWTTGVQLGMEMTRATAPDSRPDPYIEEISEVNDFSARVKLHDNLAPEIAAVRVLGNAQVVIKEDLGEPNTYREWTEMLRDAEDDEAEEIASEISDWRQEEPIGNGPLAVAEMTDSAIILEPHEEHPAVQAGSVEFDGVESIQTGDGVRAFLDGQLDAITARMPVPEDLQSEMPQEVASFNSDFNQSIHLAFNNGATEGIDPITANVDVRKAIAHIIDHEIYETNTPLSFEGYSLPQSNIATTAVDQLSFDLENFTEYYEANEEAALEHLERAGYTRENGTVVDENGETAEVNIVTSSDISDAFLVHGQTTSELLDQFGFETTFESLDNAGFSERRFEGTYDIIPDLDPMLGIIPDNSPDLWDGWFSDLYHLPDTWQIPSEIGNPDSELAEFNLIDALSQWQESGSDEDFQRVAWFHNQAVPRVTPIYGPDAGRLNTTGPWSANTDNRGLTQMRPGMKNCFRFDDSGAQVNYDG